MNNNEKKNKSTTGLWILLIILLALAGGLTYLKYFYTPKINHPEDIELTPEKINELTNITNNFNSDPLITEKTKENIIIKANLENDIIAINYTKGNIIKEYKYQYNNDILITEIDKEDEEFNLLFKIMIYATQKRLGNENRKEIDKYVNEFLDNSEEINGLYKEMVEANKITYNIEITEKIGTISSKIDKDDSEG